MFASKDALFSGAAAGYTINNSVRFRSSASAYLSRTYSNASTLRTKQTFSVWVKRGTLGSRVHITSTYDGSSGASTDLYFNASDQLEFDFGGTAVLANITNAVFRDPSSWYHIVLSIDTTQATSTNRIILYVNGVQQSLGTVNAPAQNTSCVFPQLNSNNKICTNFNNSSVFFDGYLAEYNFIDGQALTPSSFGAYNTYGVWQPAQYTGTYGTNGFYLKFASFGTAAALGTDSSGNGNTWTVNNISITSGTTYDPMLDSPTLTGATVANYCVINPVSSYGYTITNGNLTATLPSSGAFTYQTRGTTAVSSGKWYFEFITGTISGVGTMLVGVCDPSVANSVNIPSSTSGWLYYGYNGQKYNGSGAAYGSTWGSNANVAVALDMDAGTMTFYLNGVSQGTAFTNLAGRTVVPVICGDQASNTYGISANFGQQPFANTVPTGFNRLNTYNLSAPTITNGASYMAATTYTGTGAVQSISDGANTTTNVTFQPDLVWIKSRSAATNNNLFDSLRTATNYLISNSTAANATNANTLTAFNSTGFALGSDASSIGVNISTNTYVAWQWLAGAGTSSTNTNGSITSTVSVNPTAGFSVVTYTGTGANATVGHGLGAAPSMVIVKNRTSSTQNWNVWFSGFAGTNYILLNSTAATASSTTLWNSTAPSSTVFSVGTANGTNGSTNGLVAYCWSAVSGYSAFGSYTGNGSADGPFVYTGFRPRWVMIKRTDGISNWSIRDTSRDTYNTAVAGLAADSSAAESTQAAIDILSNGFKCRDAGGQNTNFSGSTYIYAAFAENPFKYALAR